VAIEPLGEIVFTRDQFRILDSAGECWSELPADLRTTQPITVRVFIDGNIVEVFVGDHYSLAARLPAISGTLRLSMKSVAVSSMRFSDWPDQTATPP
jgi:sucrose-6-phosphate hydrolase SacC (GH32 family)